MPVHVLNGIDQPERLKQALHRKRLAAMTSGGSLTREGQHLIDLLREQYTLVRLFNSIIGVRGEYRGGEHFARYTDEPSGLPVESIFCRERIAPDPSMLAGIDAVVVDVREAGVRYFEYLQVLGAMMRVCASSNVEVIVLDRPDPLGGCTVEGTVCPPEMHTIVGDWELPNRIALTLGEFARYINSEFHIGCPLTVIPVAGWQRGLFYEDTDLPWILPSPSLNGTDANLIYAGYCILEGITMISEGRGTSKPFELVGAPYLDGNRLAQELNRRHLPGAVFYPVFFKPTSSKFTGEVCQGIQTVITDRKSFRSCLTALTLVETLKELYPDKILYSDCSVGHNVKTLPSSPKFTRYFDLLLADEDFSRNAICADALLERHAPARDRYVARKRPYHLY